MLSPLLAYLKHISLWQTGKVSGKNQKIFCGDEKRVKRPVCTRQIDLYRQDVLVVYRGFHWNCLAGVHWNCLAAIMETLILALSYCGRPSHQRFYPCNTLNGNGIKITVFADAKKHTALAFPFLIHGPFPYRLMQESIPHSGRSPACCCSDRGHNLPPSPTPDR